MPCILDWVRISDESRCQLASIRLGRNSSLWEPSRLLNLVRHFNTTVHQSKTSRKVRLVLLFYRWIAYLISSKIAVKLLWVIFILYINCIIIKKVDFYCFSWYNRNAKRFLGVEQWKLK